MKHYFLVALAGLILFSGCTQPENLELTDDQYVWFKMSEGVWQKTKLDCTEPSNMCIDFCFENKEVQTQGDKKEKNNVWTKCNWDEYAITKTKNPLGTELLCFDEGGYPMLDYCVVVYSN